MNVRGVVVSVSLVCSFRRVYKPKRSLISRPCRNSHSKLINKFISPYVDNLNANDLNLAIMAGKPRCLDNVLHGIAS